LLFQRNLIKPDTIGQSLKKKIAAQAAASATWCARTFALKFTNRGLED